MCFLSVQSLRLKKYLVGKEKIGRWFGSASEVCCGVIAKQNDQQLCARRVWVQQEFRRIAEEGGAQSAMDVRDVTEVSEAQWVPHLVPQESSSNKFAE